MPNRRVDCQRQPCRGFILPFAISMLALLSMLAAAGFLLAQLEWRRSQAHRASVEAFYAADGALQQYMGERLSSAASSDSSTYTIANSDVKVSTEPLLTLDNGDRLVEAISRATLRPPEGGIAQRSLSLTLLRSPPFQPSAALTTLNTLETTGGSGVISGFDAAPPPPCGPDPFVTGILALPGPPPSAQTYASLMGNPPYRKLPTPKELERSTGLRWRLLLDPNGLPRDVRWPTDAWPSTFPSGWWPVIEVTRSARLISGQSGRGAILATGDLELAEGFSWEGLVLAGGSLRFTGRVRVEGAVLAGLNALLGTSGAARTDLTAADVSIRFHSCNVAEAAQVLALPAVAVPGSWRELMEWLP